MTRYDNLRCSFSKIRRLQYTATLLPSGIAGALVASITLQYSDAFGAFLVSGFAIAALPILLHHLWVSVFRRYDELTSEARRIKEELRSLKQSVDSIYNRYPRRQKGEQFKKAYALSGKTIADLEETLAVGMYFEVKEVFVTAFVVDGTAVRVTASIGSLFRCSASDNPLGWRNHITRLGCDEVRQYHNHPTHNNKTEPSAMDYRSCQSTKRILREHADKLRSFIVYWNEIREWRIMEYDESEEHWLSTIFDVAA